MSIDEGRADELTVAILGILKKHYVRGPSGRERVLEAVIALATATGVTLAGSGEEAVQVFFKQLEIQRTMWKDGGEG
jgi:hypothetical protein